MAVDLVFTTGRVVDRDETSSSFPGTSARSRALTTVTLGSGPCARSGALARHRRPARIIVVRMLILYIDLVSSLIDCVVSYARADGTAERVSQSSK